MKLVLVAAAAALALCACSKRDQAPTPAGSQVASAMPDTSAKPARDPNLTAPDAGATGAAEPVGNEVVGNVAGGSVPNPQAAPR
jgi:hypothetical protein